MTSGWVNGAFPFQAGGRGNPLASEPDCSASERWVWLSGVLTWSREGEAVSSGRLHGKGSAQRAVDPTGASKGNHRVMPACMTVSVTFVHAEWSDTCL